MEQKLYRKYAPMRWCATCAGGVLVLLALRALGAGLLPLVSLLAAVALLALPYYGLSWTYRWNGAALEVSQGWFGAGRPVASIDLDHVISYGVYLPGQLSARQASRVLRACLPLDPRSKRYLLYRLPEGGTGILIFSPDQALREALIQERWIFRMPAQS